MCIKYTWSVFLGKRQGQGGHEQASCCSSSCSTAKTKDNQALDVLDSSLRKAAFLQPHGALTEEVWIQILPALYPRVKHAVLARRQMSAELAALGREG